MDLITHIPGISNSAPVVPGVNTPAPWNVSHTGLTDGTSPNNATKNMAEIYNRLLLAQSAIIQDSGLTLDYTNWTQITTAIRLLGTNHGGSCPATGPASAPSPASPYTRYTSVAPYSEHWQWSPSGWFVEGNFYGGSFANSGLSLTGGVQYTFTTETMHRAGQINATLAAIGGATAGGHKMLCWIEKNTQKVAADAITGAFTADQIWCNAAQNFEVLAGDVITFIVFSGNTQTIPTRSGFRYII